MDNPKREFKSTRFTSFIALAILTISALFTVQLQRVEGSSASPAATYSHGLLHLTIPYRAPSSGTGRLIVEVLDPDDQVLGRAEQQVSVSTGRGLWKEEIKLAKSLPLEDLIWHRVHYRFEYDDKGKSALEGIESISQILQRPVIRVLGQQSYLSGSLAAVRVIVTDSNNLPISGRVVVRIDLLDSAGKPKHLFSGHLNQRGTTEAQFRFPARLTGRYQLRYLADTPIGSTKLAQPVHLQDKVSVLLTTEKPIYQPGQIIHVRALALDRSNHDASANHRLTFELEDSRGNKVFKRSTETDQFGVASAEFGLADEVNLGTYHVRALMGDPDAPTSRAETSINVDRYVLPKFKVAVEFTEKGKKQRHGYQPGDRVTGTVHANYFFGKPVEDAEISVRAVALDVVLFEAASVQGKTDSDGSYHFDLELPKYFVGRPLNHGAARVVVEATIKDSAGHSETRGEPISVNESPLMFTAVPEGGTLVPGLPNRVFVLAAYPDGTPAKADMTIHATGNPDQHVATDDGGIAIISITPSGESESLQIDASDQEGDRASSQVKLEVRATEEQILLRTERALCRSGDRIRLEVFSTRKRGTVYLDIVREGQTLLTRDVDIENGQAELILTATPEMTGTLDLGAYLIGSDAQPVADHRLVFVHPADELNIETVADAPLYKPGAEARLSFHVTNSRGEAVHAALGLQIVDEAVFALAEKQPGFAKVFFYLEQELMKPRYEIHSLGMPAIVESVPESQREQRDRAAQTLFAATEMASPEKFDAELGRDLPMTKYWEYAQRYRARLQKQVGRLAEDLNRAFKEDRKNTDPLQVYARLAKDGGPEFLDAWGTKLVLEPVPWDSTKTNLIVHSAGPDRKFKTSDDIQGNLLIRRKEIGSAHTSIDVKLEHNPAARNGLADIVGTVVDKSGAVVPHAQVEVHAAKGGRIRKVRTTESGQFRFSALTAGDYVVDVTAPGFRIASQSITLKAEDRAVMSAALSVGETTEIVEVTAEVPMLQTMMSVGGVIGGVPGGVPGGQMGGVIGGIGSNNLARVRWYFPESLYVNPEIITDRDGRAGIAIPVADSITTWRMAMIASTQHGVLGTSTSDLKVFQDFFVDLDVPVTLTQGDRVSVPVAIYNYSGLAGDVTLHLQPEDWFSLADDVADKSISLSSAGVAGSQFTLQANRIGKYKLTLSARIKADPTHADVVVREIEVIPNGREQALVFNGRLENAVEHQLAFPVGSIPDASKIRVRLYPSPLSQIVEGMDSILQMPSGCFEQTSSTTYPNVLALDYMKRTEKLTPEIHAKAEGYIANGYQRLLTFEVPGGGFSWFGDAPANKILTAYGLMEFHDMLKVYDVDPKLLQRTQQWLAGQQLPDGSWKPDTHNLHDGATDRYDSDVMRITAYIAWSLENTEYNGPAVDRAIGFIEKHMDGATDAYTLAVIANLAADYGRDREFTQHAVQQLLDSRTEKDEQVWWTTEETGVYGTGASAAVETTGIAVQALLRSGESSGVARKALTYLISKKDASGTWGTTQATIMALRALLTATEKGAADVRGTATVLLNGKPVETLVLSPENNDLYREFVFKSIEQGKANNIEIRFEGKGGLTYQVVGGYFLPWDQKPAIEPLFIDVSYDRTSLLQDDIATATATVRNNLDKAARMVILDLGIPPGFELFSEDLQDYRDKSAALKSGHLSKFSLTATQAILYFDSFAPGDTINLKYRLRAKYPIRAKTLRSRVYEYYSPDVNSVAAPVQLEVRKR
jgi:A-macroglobulin TED domain/Carboxypeptidase regulatory-like domain/Alpha-2-macroglobulin family/MG2 domain/A-macroglobulin receptor binding domain/Alpha-2-macroglobulin bait region domain